MVLALVVAPMSMSPAMAVEFDARTQAGPIEFSSCATISQSGTYALTGDITDSSNDPCITIMASDVVLDGQGHTVDGVGEGTGIAVGSASNVTVRNLAVSQWETGINYESVTNGTVAGVTATDITTSGISIRFSSGITVTDVEATGARAGIYLYSSNENAVTDSTVSNNADGVYVGGEGNSISGVTARDNENGVHVESGTETRLSNLTVTGSEQHGFMIRFSSGTELTDVDAADNTVAFYSYGNSITDVENLALSSDDTISFTARDVLLSQGAEPTNVPSDRAFLETFVNVSGTSSGQSWLNLSVPYTDDEVSAIDESTLQIWKYAGGNWEQVLAQHTVDTEANVLTTNVTAIGTETMTLVPLGQPTAETTPTTAETTTATPTTAETTTATTTTGETTEPANETTEATNISIADATFAGQAARAFAGTAVAVGDVNGDGTDDVLVGAPQSSSVGEVFLFYGPVDFESVTLSASNADAVFHGAAQGDLFGQSIDVGDIDGDGMEDIVVGAPGRSTRIGHPGFSSAVTSGVGAAYVFYGSSDLSATRNASAADAQLLGDSDAGGFAGFDVAVVDNQSGETAAGVVVGAPTNGLPSEWLGVSNASGAAYFVPDEALSGMMELSDVEVSFAGQVPGEAAGVGIATGDFDGDGNADVLVGAPGLIGVNVTGSAYVVSGPFGNDTVNLSDADARLVGEQPEDSAGYAVAAGDVNGDGTDDALVGARRSNRSQPRGGIAYGVFGPVSDEVPLSDASVTLSSDERDAGVGTNLLAADVNGDDFDDILIGAPGQVGSGMVHLVLAAETLPESIQLSGADVTFAGERPGDHLGSAIAVGDVNGNGQSDLLVGASDAERGGNVQAGAAYLVSDVGGANATNASLPPVETRPQIDPSNDSGAQDLEPEALEQFTNDEFGYRINYPANWTLVERTTQQAIFEPAAQNGQLIVSTIDVGEPLTVDELSRLAIINSRSRMNDLQVLGQRNVTLESGQQGRVVEMRYDNPNDAGGLIHAHLLLVPVGNTVLQVEIVLAEEDYDEEFEQVANAIIDSFIITKSG